ncbi:hypothetical protein I549_0611 [Mycobacterium avium subsp. avium 2285 (R)]|nr:hypothetical protein I549_0611 [Mycobacterium avium subsp. avium 2285 (R)]
MKANRKGRQTGLTTAATQGVHRTSPGLYFKEEPMKRFQ